MCESYAMHIPSGGITDTDALPHSVLFPIPGNDDAFGSIFFFNQLVAKTTLIAKISSLLVNYRKFSVQAEIKILKHKLRKLRNLLFNLKNKFRHKARYR